jgi:hypothetical protein
MADSTSVWVSFCGKGGGGEAADVLRDMVDKSASRIANVVREIRFIQSNPDSHFPNDHPYWIDSNICAIIRKR